AKPRCSTAGEFEQCCCGVQQAWVNSKARNTSLRNNTSLGTRDSCGEQSVSYCIFTPARVFRRTTPPDQDDAAAGDHPHISTTAGAQDSCTSATEKMKRKNDDFFDS
ncbi:unnamed protein product, partial [Amoebophrya sp. A25]